MAIPRRFIEELRDAVPVSSVVGKRVRLTRQGAEAKGLCPFHNEKSPSFTVNDDKQFYHCFGCGAHGTALDFLMETENLSFVEAVESLASAAGLQVPRESAAAVEQEQKAKGLKELTEAAAGFFERQLRSTQGAQAVEYLKGRGLTGRTAKQFRLGYAPQGSSDLVEFLKAEGFKSEDILATGLARQPDDGRAPYSFFRGRLMFPILDGRGAPIAFGGRILGAGEPKYLNSPDSPLFDKGRTLYGLSHARAAARSAGRLIVTEGYMDAIALHQAGFHEAIAPLGTAITENHLKAAWRIAPEVWLCFDGDAAGQKAGLRAATRALPVIEAGQKLRLVTLPQGEDPDSIVQQWGPTGFNKVLSSARDLADVLWDVGTESRPLRNPDDAAKARRELRRLAGEFADPDLKQSYGTLFEERIAPFFDRQRASARGGGAGGRKAGSGKGGKAFSRSPAYGQADQAKLTPGEWQSRRRTELLFAAFLQQPSLIERYIEGFGELEVADMALRRLQSAMVEAAFCGAHLDRAALQAHFAGSGDILSISSEIETRSRQFPERVSLTDVADADELVQHLLQLESEEARRREALKGLLGGDTGA